jgi:hypothetical protein
MADDSQSVKSEFEWSIIVGTPGDVISLWMCLAMQERGHTTIRIDLLIFLRILFAF